MTAEPSWSEVANDFEDEFTLKWCRYCSMQLGGPEALAGHLVDVHHFDPRGVW